MPKFLPKTIWVVGLLAAGLLAAQVDEPVFDPGPGVTSPKVIRQVNPQEDPGRQGFRLSGVVLIGLVVSAKGMPMEVHVVRSLDPGVDKSAVEAVKEWRFEPGRKDGAPVAVRVTVEIRFHDL